MRIDKLVIQIGNHEVILMDIEENRDVHELMEKAGFTNFVVTIRVLPTQRAVALLGRLMGSDGGPLTEYVAALSKRFDVEFHGKISVHLAKLLKRYNYIYVWEVAERSEAELLKTGGVGPKSLREIKDLLQGEGLELGMNLSSVMAQLPLPPRETPS